jgi:hypothetical protein
LQIGSCADDGREATWGDGRAEADAVGDNGGAARRGGERRGEGEKKGRALRRDPLSRRFGRAQKRAVTVKNTSNGAPGMPSLNGALQA